MYLKKCTLLYVEDDDIMREYIYTLLQDKIKDIFFAKNGKEGLVLYHETKPDIVLSDINMPLLDGLQMSKSIKQQNKDQAIILLTGADDTHNLINAINIGINSFIQKPVLNEQVLNILEDTAFEIYNTKQLIKHEEIKANKERINLILSIIQEINHHWRQPLTSMLLISSSYEFKKRTKHYKNEEEEIADMNYITNEIKKLANILKKLEIFELSNTKLEDIEQIIKISNPIHR